MHSLSDSLRAELERGISQKIFPGAVALVGTQEGEILSQVCAGTFLPEGQGAPMTPETIFDLASVTKVACTTTLLMIAASRGWLSPQDLVSQHRPEFVEGCPPDDPKRSVQLQHLLTHTSGCHWWLPFYQRFREEAGAPALGSLAAKHDVYQRAARNPLDAPPGTQVVYSDLNFILLGSIVEDLFRAPLEEAFAREVAAPTGSQCHYRPAANGPYADTPPTEFCLMRSVHVSGSVHDENTWSMGGVSGHAGLFGRAFDLFRIACALRPDVGFIPRQTLEQFWLDAPPGPGTYVLGWDTPSASASSAGRCFSPRSVGHTGFTGTSLWIDRERRIVSVLLTNRVYFGRQDTRIREFRNQYHTALGQSLGWEIVRPA